MTNLPAILMMIGSMAFFAMADALIKVNSAMLNPGQIIVVLALGGVVIYAIAGRIRGEPLWTPAFFAPAVIGRNLAEVLGTFGMITALSRVDLTTVAAILQTTPLIVTVLAAVVLRETVRWRRWMAVGIGFCGMLLIVRPGSAAFEPNVLYAVLGMLALSFRDLFTRMTPRDLPTTTLASFGVISIMALGLPLVLLGSDPILPADANIPSILAMVVLGAAGYFLITLALRGGEVSVVAPFRYTRLIFAMTIGVVFLGERPDALTLVGAGLIMASGLYAFMRERKRNTAFT